ncbi:flavodoxin-like fold protein [Cladophialophora chaetospira]|uniref:Flavodoxin-like fold protein n=1 Tax=Cladophialophora chaetospira TaxID=386627 RepID=A0AA39CMH9_9EURO|nr:flavodoxin-like fold protein [Cladophialophora chaetospira]
MAPRIAIVFYSLHGHIQTLAEAAAKGVEIAGGKADIFQVAETFSPEVLQKMHAAPKADYPVASAQTLLEYDGFLLGIPTRYGNMPAQWKAFWDRTGGIWAKAGYSGKFAGIFVTSGTPGGGQESTFLSAMSTLAHHGIIFVPLGYKEANEYITNLDEVHGGSPWGAGAYAVSIVIPVPRLESAADRIKGGDGSRAVSGLEKKIAEIQGQAFFEKLSKVKFD